MKLKITIIIFLFSYWLTPVFACGCASYEDKGFCDFVDYAEFVVDATVTERMDREGQLRIRINEVFKGVEAIANEIVLHNTMCSTWLSEELGGVNVQVKKVMVR